MERAHLWVRILICMVRKSYASFDCQSELFQYSNLKAITLSLYFVLNALNSLKHNIQPPPTSREKLIHLQNEPFSTLKKSCIHFITDNKACLTVFPKIVV